MLCKRGFCYTGSRCAHAWNVTNDNATRGLACFRHQPLTINSGTTCIFRVGCSKQTTLAMLIVLSSGTCGTSRKAHTEGVRILLKPSKTPLQDGARPGRDGSADFRDAVDDAGAAGCGAHHHLPGAPRHGPAAARARRHWRHLLQVTDIPYFVPQKLPLLPLWLGVLAHGDQCKGFQGLPPQQSPLLLSSLQALLWLH